jgi:hypothetical protein
VGGDTSTKLAGEERRQEAEDAEHHERDRLEL